MWLEAIVTEEDLVQVMTGFLPVKIYLHPEGDQMKKDRWLLLKPATEVALVPGQGLQVTCPAELTWGLLGMSPTVVIDALRVLIRPQVTQVHKGHVLEFRLEVDEADLHSLPDFVDAAVVKAVNAALATKELAWNFSQTLTRTVALGNMLDPVEALTIEVLWGKHRIGAAALILVVSFKLGFVRSD